MECLAAAQVLNGLGVNHYESLLNVKQILGTESLLTFYISPLLLSRSLHTLVGYFYI